MRQESKISSRTALLAVLTALTMLCCTLPLVSSEDTEALRGSSNMSLNATSAMIYVDTSSSDHSYSFTATRGENCASGTICWKLNDLGDGTTLVSFSSSGNTYTTTGDSVTVYARSTGSIEIEAYVSGTTNCYASAVIVVKESEETAANAFHFYIQINTDDYSYVQANYSASAVIPSGFSSDEFEDGTWIHVTQAETGLSDANFNACSALKWYISNNHWLSSANYIADSGWISTFLGLGTYEGPEYVDDDGNVLGNYWYYWAQYTLTNNGWTFNNTTLGYITEEDSSYIGLIFWASPPTMDVPEDCPDFPA